MFEISFPELVILAVVALLVLGPERLPRAARFAGLWVRKARAQWHSVKSEMEREIALEDMRRSMDEARQTMQEMNAAVMRREAEANAATSPPDKSASPPDSSAP